MLKSIYTGLLSLLALGIQAQQLPVMNHYIYNPYLYNPARSGARGAAYAAVHFKKQWVEMPNSPITGALALDAPLKAYNMGLGGLLYTDQTHIIQRTGGLFSSAYHLRLNEDRTHLLSGGISLGFIHQRFNFAEASLVNPNDPQTFPDQAKGTAIDFSLGLNYRWRDLNVGFSMLQGLNNQLNIQSNLQGEISYVNSRHLLFNGSYRWGFGEGNGLFYVEPSMLVRIVRAMPVQVESNLMLGWRNLLWLGLGYRSSNNNTSTSAMMLSFGVELQERFLVGYTVEFNVENRWIGSLGTQHEVTLAYRFGEEGGKMDQRLRALEAQEQRLKGIEERQNQQEQKLKALDSLSKEQKKLEEALKRKNDLDEEQSRRLDEQLQQLKDQQKVLDKHGVEIDSLQRRMTEGRDLGQKKVGEVFFGEGSSVLDAESKIRLDAIVSLYQKEAKDKSFEVYLFGYGSQTGDRQMNERISTQRTIAVRQYLIQKGLNGDRIVIMPLGKRNPSDKVGSSSQDRRVDIIFVAD